MFTITIKKLDFIFYTRSGHALANGHYRRDFKAIISQASDNRIRNWIFAYPYSHWCSTNGAGWYLCERRP